MKYALIDVQTKTVKDVHEMEQGQAEAVNRIFLSNNCHKWIPFVDWWNQKGKYIWNTAVRQASREIYGTGAYGFGE